jgi:hypothetical protein
MPNPQNVSVDEVVELIQNMPEKKRQKVISKLSSGDIGGSLGL